ncbi:(d)CMP kinase, partial [Micrococcus luteus]|uniref:(d)CMP kinase n=1 Tax=Micrococcus luteus TaxID=1270 RepID=UPI001646A660
MTEHTRDDVAPAPLVVAVDGPSGSGKSSVSKAVARRLGAAYLDTGAMYRAVAWHCLHEGVDLADAEAVAMDLDQSTDPDVEAVRVGGTDVTEAIRGPEVT